MRKKNKQSDSTFYLFQVKTEKKEGTQHKLKQHTQNNNNTNT